VFSSEHFRADIEKQIARKARISEEDVIIDVPTLPSVPYQQTADMQPMDVPVFKRVPLGKKQIVPLAEVSRIVGVLQTFMKLVRVYTGEAYRSRVELAAHQILGDAQGSRKTVR
jgi:hypothetical protein